MKRFRVSSRKLSGMVEDPEGPYVFHADAAREIQKLTLMNQALQRRLDELRSEIGWRDNPDRMGR